VKYIVPILLGNKVLTQLSDATHPRVNGSIRERDARTPTIIRFLPLYFIRISFYAEWGVVRARKQFNEKQRSKRHRKRYAYIT
jgi:hypothetical protein